MADGLRGAKDKGDMRDGRACMRVDATFAALVHTSALRLRPLVGLGGQRRARRAASRAARLWRCEKKPTDGKAEPR